jgi:hypothetical protein
VHHFPSTLELSTSSILDFIISSTVKADVSRRLDTIKMNLDEQNDGEEDDVVQPKGIEDIPASQASIEKQMAEEEYDDSDDEIFEDWGDDDESSDE